jgi:hypothetical protein
MLQCETSYLDDVAPTDESYPDGAAGVAEAEETISHELEGQISPPP